MKPSEMRTYARNKYQNTRRMFSHLRTSLLNRKPKVLVLAYHRVMPAVPFNPLRTIIPRSVFTDQISAIAKKMPIVTLESAIRQCQSGEKIPALQAVLTFDDGYADNFTQVFPLLKKHGLPGVFFLPTGLIGSKNKLWDWDLMNVLCNNESITRINFNGFQLSQKPFESRLRFALRVFSGLKSQNAKTIEDCISDLKDKMEPFQSDKRAAADFMDWDQIRSMSAAGMEIGSHAQTHISLTSMPFDEAKKEIRTGKEIIEKQIKKQCLHFAFPFGSNSDYTIDLVGEVKNAGFISCVLNTHGFNAAFKEIFCLKRIIMDETVDVNYLLG